MIRSLDEPEVERDAIETLGVSVRERLIRTGKGEERVHVYVATNSLRATTPQAGRAGELIGVAIDAGATSVGQLTFFRSDARERYRDQLPAAFDDARAKTQRLADEAGFEAG